MTIAEDDAGACIELFYVPQQLPGVRGVLNTPHKYQGLVVGNLACLGWGFATTSIFYSIFSLFMSKICFCWTFHNPNTCMRLQTPNTNTSTITTV